jgi:Tol biopolymer transport system component
MDDLTRRLAPCVLALASWPLSTACRGQEARARSGPEAASPAGAGVAELVYERVVAGNQDLYVQPAGGGVERRLTSHPAQDGLPRFTPDGLKVLFSSDRSGNFQIWEVDAAGGDASARRVRTNGDTEWQVDLAPDGKRLAYLSNQGGPESLWLLEPGKAEPRLLVRHGANSILGNPDWSPNGLQIVFSSNWRIGHQIYLADVTAGKADRVSALTRGGCEPRFHPDGRRIVYVSRGHMSEKSRLVEVDLASGGETVLVDWPALNYDPAYSPDGSEIAFASNITGEYAIYRQRLSDGKSWRVTHGPGPARYPDYRP